MTVKTVEMHLGNAYRKLGIHSRRELAGADPGRITLGCDPGRPRSRRRGPTRDDHPMHARVTTYENVDLELVDEVQRFVESQDDRPVRRPARLRADR